MQHSSQGMQASRFIIHVDLLRNDNLSHFTAAAGYELGVYNSLKPLKLGKRRGGGDGLIPAVAVAT